ncbi:ROK family transcriptional regulator [Mycetocola tolaasinivorans]|uniref:ROK family transcriptional regulator n=1 Tax=Mycetocola tolaasinivorans TaxID=76635 RepID=A0A3L7A258_9MICO|nr:ROK family transcriptional regulator [Mycetocola tolaasinivorans]RLP74088.1 ROK family transcriptional regulator [Mycetocola tolaasinivorans]
MKPTGSNLDAVRRHNLGRILDLVHREGSLSRSALTRETGLNRSTIAALVAELVSRGLVVEGVPATEGVVGRPSPVVSPSEGTVVLAINPEYDAITVAAVTLGGRVIERVRRGFRTGPSVQRAVTESAALVSELRGRLPSDVRIAGIGVAVPALVRAEDGMVRLAPRLGWVDAPLAELLADVTGLPVLVDNDASLGARAEYHFGAGRGIDDLIYLNGGASGIGGGLILGGRPIRGAGGYAGEFGHTFSTEGGIPLERAVTRDALVDAVAPGADIDDAELERLLRATPHPITATHAEILGRSLGGMINIVNPSRIVLGGFLGIIAACEPELLAARVARYALVPPGEEAEIVRAELGADLLLIGAAEPVIDRLIADPGRMPVRLPGARPAELQR